MEKEHRGFTLMELLIAVSIVAILASIALPRYQRTVARARLRAARDILLTIYAGEQVYLELNGSYKQIASPNAPQAEWLEIFMDNPNTNAPPGITFTVPEVGTTPPTFRADADRAGQAGMSIDQAQDIDCQAMPVTDCPPDLRP